jgi:TonB family protein
MAQRLQEYSECLVSINAAMKWSTDGWSKSWRGDAGRNNKNGYRSPQAGVMISINNSSLASSLIASCLIHAIVGFLAPTLFTKGSNRVQQNLIAVRLFELPSVKQETPPQEEEKLNSVKKMPVPPPAPKVETIKSAEPMATKAPLDQPSPRLTSPLKEEAVKSPESRTTLPAAHVPPNATGLDEDGASEAGAGNLFGQGDIGVIAGAGTSGRDGDTAASGLGRGPDAPGLQASRIPLRTNREATPVQTVRASYPPMALRMGIEGDVTLRIEIDSEGKVTKADIVKSGGAAFDEEAVKAVKQARFEPANKDGRNMPAEFTYVYRFRLRK